VANSLGNRNLLFAGPPGDSQNAELRSKHDMGRHVALSIVLLLLSIEHSYGSASSGTQLSSRTKLGPLLKSFTPKGSKVISAHGRADDGQSATEALELSQKQSSIRILIRAIRLIAIFSPNILTAWLAILIPPLQGLWFRVLSISLAYSGAAFIKWGQV
jgi:hypothetical protein